MSVSETLGDEWLQPYYDRPKLQGWEFYKSIGSPKYVVAPMVDQSELPFRLLCKKYGAELTYTPMFHSRIFLDDPTYRYDQFQTASEEVPLLIQLCGNDPQTVLEAAKIALKMAAKQGHDHIIAGVDLNLGCPQRIARRGNYGAYLMDDLNTVREIVSTLHRELPVPVTCKIRKYPQLEHTLAYADMLVEAGCQLLVVHGRTREQKGHNQGLADWDIIKAVKDRVKSIPVIANGNIRYFADVEQCMQYTGVDGVMSACGLLDNPALFANLDNKDKLEIAYEYIEIAEKYPAPAIAMAKAHLFKFVYDIISYPYNADLRFIMSGNKCRSATDYRGLIDQLKERYDKYGDNSRGDAPIPEVKHTKKNRVEDTDVPDEEEDYEDLEGIDIFSQGRQ